MSGAKRETPTKLSNLEFLRFIAAAMVVVYHTLGGLFLKGYDLGFMSFFYPLGAAGVDIFFVISGFVIYLGVFRQRKSPWLFLKSRLRRIVPAYWIATIAMVAFTVALGTLSSLTGFTSTLEPITVPWFFESLFFVSGLFGNTFPVLGQGWSLEYEMFFYLLVTAGLMFRPRFVVFILPALVLLTLVSASLISTMVLEFLFGGLIALAYTKFRHVGTTVSVLTVVLSVSLFVVSQTLRGTGFRVEYLWIPASALLVFGSVMLPQTRNHLTLTLGSASYAVYLLHGFTYMLTNFAFSALAPQGGPTAVMVCVLVSVLFAELVGILFERHIDAPLRSALSQRGF